MKLPPVEYAPVQTASSSIALDDGPSPVDQAVRNLTQTVATGLTALGMEIVKTQGQKATVELHKGLAELEQELNSKRYVSSQYVRDRLGADVGALPEEIRKQLTRKVRDPSTGEDLEVDREDIPTWLVAGALYQKRAEELKSAASGKISGQGWQTKFQREAEAEINDRHARFTRDQAAAMVADQRDEQHATISQFTRLGEHDRALDAIEGSAAFTPGEKALLREQVLSAKQRAEEGSRENQLLAAAEAKARELEAKYRNDPQAATREAQAIPGALGAKVAQRLKERENDRTEAEADAVRSVKGQLEIEVRASRIRNLSQLERLDAYRQLPQWAQADLVQVLNGEAERRARLSQMQGDKEWAQELARFEGMPDREKVRLWPTYQERVPFAYQGGFAKATEAARMRLTNAWDSEDVQKTFDLAAGATKGLNKAMADQLKLRGRRWYDDETRRRQGVPPTQQQAAEWLAKALQYGDENGDAMFGGDDKFRFQYEIEAEKAGRPVVFQPFSSEEQKYPPSALTVGAPAAPAAPAAPSVPAPLGQTAPHDLTRPIVFNPDGSFSTEITATFEVGGKHVVLPTIVGGRKYSPRDALQLYREGKNQAVGIFDRAEDADRYAQQRHEEEARLRAADAQLPRPKTPAEARALPAGTRFLDPDGYVRVR